MQEIIITGNIGKDAEQGTRHDGSKYLSFRVAVDEGKDKDPTWYGVYLFGGNLDNIQQYLVRGARVLVRGRLTAGAYTDRRGDAQLALAIWTRSGGLEIIRYADSAQ